MRSEKFCFGQKLIKVLILFILFGMILDAAHASDFLRDTDDAAVLSVQRHAERDALSQIMDQCIPLEPGSIGNDVLKMKVRLGELGYFSDLNLSNIYDDATVKCLRLFQNANSLSPTGIADSLTLALLFSDFAVSADTYAEISTTVPQMLDAKTYILNLNTKKFHYEYCSSVDQMKEKNKKPFTGSREEIIDMGYDPCGRCKP